MRIKSYATVETEVEVNVDIGDVISELCNRADHADHGHWRVFTPSIDVLTRLLDRMPSETIAAMPENVRAICRKRFELLAKRFSAMVEREIE